MNSVIKLLEAIKVHIQTIIKNMGFKDENFEIILETKRKLMETMRLIVRYN